MGSLAPRAEEPSRRHNRKKAALELVAVDQAAEIEDCEALSRVYRREGFCLHRVPDPINNPADFDEFTRWMFDQGFRVTISQGMRNLSVTIKDINRTRFLTVSSLCSADDGVILSDWTMVKRCLLAGAMELWRSR